MPPLRPHNCQVFQFQIEAGGGPEPRNLLIPTKRGEKKPLSLSQHNHLPSRSMKIFKLTMGGVGEEGGKGGNALSLKS